MLELQGKYAAAKVFADIVDSESISQVIGLLNQPYAAGSRIRMMPDIHAGAGCTIGTTMTVTDKVCPNLVGVDIGCGMETVRLRETDIDLAELDAFIRREIPSGFSVRTKPHAYGKRVPLQDLHCVKAVTMDRAEKSIGTLGGGNHFIEINRDEEGGLYLVIHSGSRHLGVEIAKYYQNAGIQSLKDRGESGIPKPLAYVDGWLMDRYLHDMQIAQQYARVNRQAMADSILTGLGLHGVQRLTTVHNYIDTETMILRKGAVSAEKGEELLIPINMRDGSLLCVGKGNPDWNCSAPHGAGRLMSRGQAKESFTLTEFRRAMEGIYTTSVDRSTLDECPMAYKSMDAIVGCIGPTAEIVKVIRPIYNFKAGGE